MTQVLGLSRCEVNSFATGVFEKFWAAEPTEIYDPSGPKRWIQGWGWKFENLWHCEQKHLPVLHKALQVLLLMVQKSSKQWLEMKPCIYRTKGDSSCEPVGYDMLWLENHQQHDVQFQPKFNAARYRPLPGHRHARARREVDVTGCWWTSEATLRIHPTWDMRDKEIASKVPQLTTITHFSWGMHHWEWMPWALRDVVVHFVLAKCHGGTQFFSTLVWWLDRQSWLDESILTRNKR